MNSATLLLPERTRFGAQRLKGEVAKALGRADRATVAGDQRTRIFDILPRGWPVAAVTRQRDAGDAALSAWLRADPAYVRPDINGARLLAYGSALSLTQEECTDLLRPLRPLFGDAGFHIDAPTPSRWYLRLPREAKLPLFASPDEALGADLFEHLPDGPEGKRWRALLSETQVVLHNHPVNEKRTIAGKPPVNSLWFWGAGGSQQRRYGARVRSHGPGRGIAAAATLGHGRWRAPVRPAPYPRSGPAAVRLDHPHAERLAQG
jgi:hypothetical protein